MMQVASTSGCDSWTPTWAPDGNLYTAVGDCRPDGVPHKLGMGFGRISGDDRDTASPSRRCRPATRPTGMMRRSAPAWRRWATALPVRRLPACCTSTAASGTGSGTSARPVPACGSSSPTTTTHPYPTFTWVDWSLPEVGYASFVQYGQGIRRRAGRYVYAVIPMRSSAAGSVSNSAYDAGARVHPDARISRIDLTLKGSWQYFCGERGQSRLVRVTDVSDPDLSRSGHPVHPPRRHELEPGARQVHALAGLRSDAGDHRARHPLPRRAHGPGLARSVGSVADWCSPAAAAPGPVAPAPQRADPPTGALASGPTFLPST